MSSVQFWQVELLHSDMQKHLCAKVTVQSRCQRETAFGMSSCYSRTLNGIRARSFSSGGQLNLERNEEKNNINHKCAFLCFESNSVTPRRLDCVAASIPNRISCSH